MDGANYQRLRGTNVTVNGQLRPYKYFEDRVVPGPYKPQDFDSFLWPFVKELLKLAAGIKAYDLSSDEIFALRAFLILEIGRAHV